MNLRHPLLALASAAALLTGCNYSNPHGSQDLPPVIRIDSEPIGAKLRVVRMNFETETPCDLSEHVSINDEIVVTLEGYKPWMGLIRDLPITSLGTYRVTLLR